MGEDRNLLASPCMVTNHYIELCGRIYNFGLLDIIIKTSGCPVVEIRPLF